MMSAVVRLILAWIVAAQARKIGTEAAGMPA
jgi:hypothetical protein